MIADNCTDATADVARSHGAEVYTTVENRHRKAGGLNQLLARLLPTIGPLDAVLVMDADTVMVDDFLERAVAEFDAICRIWTRSAGCSSVTIRPDSSPSCNATSTSATDATSPAAKAGCSC